MVSILIDTVSLYTCAHTLVSHTDTSNACAQLLLFTHTHTHTQSKLTGSPLHALMTEASGLPLADATGVGCAPTVAVAVGADFGVQDSIDILLDLIAGAFAKGAPRIKLKCCKGWDSKMLTAVRARFPPPAVFHIDCNGGYDLRNPADLEFLKSLDQYEVC